MIRNVTALLPVADIDAACRFMGDCLGFATTFSAPGIAFCESDRGAVRSIQAPDDADLDDPARQLAVYLDCDDVDELWQTHSEAIAKLPETHRRAPFDRDYGQREFHLIHGPFLFMVGHRIKKENT